MKNNKNQQGFIIPLILLIIVVVVIVSITHHKKPVAHSTKNTSGTSSVADKKTLDQNAAENYCQDAALLQKYINIKTTSIVTLSYNPQYNDSGSHAANGDKIYSLQWDGKNKTTGDKILFVCDVSGTDKKITLHNLAIDGTSVYGPVDEN
ncbi:MAG TPA: hypothetical protein VIJ68_01950 [Candidatus Saccharimonadales bacterium]